MSATDEDLRQANDKLEPWKATAKGLADRVVRMAHHHPRLAEECEDKQI
jgi:hypothetical protein